MGNRAVGIGTRAVVPGAFGGALPVLPTGCPVRSMYFSKEIMALPLPPAAPGKPFMTASLLDGVSRDKISLVFVGSNLYFCTKLAIIFNSVCGAVVLLTAGCEAGADGLKTDGAADLAEPIAAGGAYA